MRFGLSDLEELPSLKEFEQLARAALGADEGIAAIEPEPSEPVASGESNGNSIEVQTATAPESEISSEAPEVTSAESEPQHGEQTKAESAS